jgi:hypothetical protein
MIAIVMSVKGIERTGQEKKKNKVARESLVYKSMMMKMEPTNNCPDDVQMTSSSRDLFSIYSMFF